MLDPPATVLDTVSDGLGGVGVCGDEGAGVVSALDHGANLGTRELQLLDPVGRTADTTRAHDLDEVGTRPDLLAHTAHALGHAIDDATETCGGTAAAKLVVVRATEVGMAASLAQSVASQEQARAGEDTVLDGLAKGSQCAAAISNRCKAAMQHLGADVGLSEDGNVVGVAKGFRQVAEARHSHQVDVRVDQARGEEFASAIDHFEAIVGSFGDGWGGRIEDGFDAAVLQLDGGIVAETARGDVDDGRVGEDVSPGRGPQPGLEVCFGNHSEDV